MVKILLNFLDLIEIKLKYSGNLKNFCIINLKCLSLFGFCIYFNYKNILRILNGMGIVIVLILKGLMMD